MFALAITSSISRSSTKALVYYVTFTTKQDFYSINVINMLPWGLPFPQKIALCQVSVMIPILQPTIQVTQPDSLKCCTTYILFQF
jgi:hypothetical protein